MAKTKKKKTPVTKKKRTPRDWFLKLPEEQQRNILFNAIYEQLDKLHADLVSSNAEKISTKTLFKIWGVLAVTRLRVV